MKYPPHNNSLNWTALVDFVICLYLRMLPLGNLPDPPRQRHVPPQSCCRIASIRRISGSFRYSTLLATKKPLVAVTIPKFIYFYHYAPPRSFAMKPAKRPSPRHLDSGTIFNVRRTSKQNLKSPVSSLLFPFLRKLVPCTVHRLNVLRLLGIGLKVLPQPRDQIVNCA